MDETISSEPDSDVSKELRPDAHPSKRRKVVHEKTVVSVKIGSNVGKLKNEGPPSDLWSWRKYGQKPIKGSPYPRGYYRCSTSKGCSAKKQVERSKTDASVLIITYTCSHNHPGPDDLISTADLTTQSPPKQAKMEKQPKTEDRDQEQEQGKLVGDAEDHFHYIESPIRCSQVEEDLFRGTGTHSDNDIGFLLDEEQEKEPPISYSQLMSFSSTPKSSQENDFFDELEELPTFSSSFPSFMASNNFFLETIPSAPS